MRHLSLTAKIKMMSNDEASGPKRCNNRPRRQTNVVRIAFARLQELSLAVGFFWMLISNWPAIVETWLPSVSDYMFPQFRR